MHAQQKVCPHGTDVGYELGLRQIPQECASALSFLFRFVFLYGEAHCPGRTHGRRSRNALRTLETIEQCELGIRHETRAEHVPVPIRPAVLVFIAFALTRTSATFSR